MTEKQQAAFRARQDRLRKVAETIDRSPNGSFFGADYELGYKFLFGELVELQRKFNELFGEYMQGDERYTDYYEQIIMAMSSGEAVLLDSISPAKNEKLAAEYWEQHAQASGNDE